MYVGGFHPPAEGARNIVESMKRRAEYFHDLYMDTEMKAEVEIGINCETWSQLHH
jgi:hypothetical protein